MGKNVDKYSDLSNESPFDLKDTWESPVVHSISPNKHKTRNLPIINSTEGDSSSSPVLTSEKSSASEGDSPLWTIQNTSICPEGQPKSDLDEINFFLQR